MDEKTPLSLTNIKGGAAVEMFDIALQKVLENMNDINTTLKSREVNLKVTFTPSEDRTLFEITLDCTPKLAHQEGQRCTADLRLDSRGRAVAFERNKQPHLPFASNVHKLSE